MKRLLLEQLLQEFNKDDREEVMRYANDFGVSYEIELESEASLCGEDGEYERDEARAERARDRLDYDHFYEQAGERESDQYFDYNIETGEDARELVEWFLGEDPSDLGFDFPADQEMRMVNHVLNSIGYNNSDKGFKEVVVRILSDDTKAGLFFEAIRANGAIVDHLRKYKKFDHETKSKKTQRTFGKFDGEMGDEVEFIGGLESLNLKGRVDLFNHYVFNLEDTEIGENFPVGSDVGGFGEATIDMFDLFEDTWELESEYETVNEHGVSDIDEVFFERYATMRDIADKQERNYNGIFLPGLVDSISTRVENDIDTTADDQLGEFRDDPLDYLEHQMGWDSWDDEYQNYHADEEDYATDKEGMLWEHLPNFMNKYANNLKIEDDCSLTNGLEFSMDNPLYMTGLEDAFEFLDILFEDLNNQDNFRFDNDTGLHTNISYLGKSGDPIEGKNYNFMKSLLFLNHKFATKEFGRRAHSTWAADIKGKAIDKIGGMLRADEMTQGRLTKHFGDEEVKKNKMMDRSIMGHLLKKRFEDLNSILSSAVVEKAAQMGGKSIGFNLSHFEYGVDYVEFRYPGGAEVTAKKIEEATLYYSYLILLAANPEFKKKEYQAKLVGLLNNLNFESTEKAKGLAWVKKIKKGTIFTDYSKRRKDDTINWKNLISYSIPQKVIDGHRHRGDANYNFATDNDYVMFKKIDLKKKEARFAYIVDRAGGSRPTRNGHPQNGLLIDEFTIPLKNFELDLQDGTMAPLGMGPKWSFDAGSDVSWNQFKDNASGEVTALTQAKRKFIQQVFAAVQKHPGEILVKDLNQISDKSYERRERINSITRVIDSLQVALESKMNKVMGRKEILKLIRNMAHEPADKVRKWVDKISAEVSAGKREHPAQRAVSSRFFYDDDWKVFQKYKDKDYKGVDIVNATHQNIRDFMDKMDISTQQMQDIEKKQTDKMINKLLSAF